MKNKIVLPRTIAAAVIAICSVQIGGSAPSANNEQESIRNTLWRSDFRKQTFAGGKTWQDVAEIASVFISQQLLALVYRVNGEKTLWAKFVDTSTGALRFEKHWDKAMKLVPTQSGDFLVVGGNRLTLYSNNSELLKQADISTDEHGYDLVTSPGGHYAYVQVQHGPLFVLIKINAQSLQDLEHWTSDRSFLPAIGQSYSDDKVAFVGSGSSHNSLFLRALNQDSPPVNSPLTIHFDPKVKSLYTAAHGWVGTPLFITQQSIALWGANPTITIVNTDGKVVFSDTPAHRPHYAVDPVVASAGGSRFALRLATEWLNFSDFPRCSPLHWIRCLRPAAA